MCNNFKKVQEVTLGNGHVLEATGEGTVQLQTKLPDGKTRKGNFAQYQSSHTAFSVY